MIGNKVPVKKYGIAKVISDLEIAQLWPPSASLAYHIQRAQNHKNIWKLSNHNI